MPLSELIERLERATGPSRDLDGEIALYNGMYRGDVFLGRAPEFTVSLDAALTLVPQGWQWQLDNCGGGGDTPCRCELGTDIWAEAATPALALVAAALKARQTGESDENAG